MGYKLVAWLTTLVYGRLLNYSIVLLRIAIFMGLFLCSGIYSMCCFPAGAFGLSGFPGSVRFGPSFNGLFSSVSLNNIGDHGGGEETPEKLKLNFTSSQDLQILLS